MSRFLPTLAGALFVLAPLGTSAEPFTLTTIAGFNFPSGLARASDGTLYVADRDNHTIRQLTLHGTNWVSATIAGTPGVSGAVDGTNSVARFWFPTGLAISPAGEIFVADTAPASYPDPL